MKVDLPTLPEFESAATLVHRYVAPTPQYAWPLLSQRAGCTVWVKHENHTPVGSFKVRGGLVYLDWLRRAHPDVTGVISATRGNHGQSIAFAAKQFGMRAVLVVPHGNSPEKNAAMRALGADLVEHGEDFHSANHYADELATGQNLFRVPSFDPLLVRGVGTYALELFRNVSRLDTVYVPIGWGSGATGVAAARKALGLTAQIVGVVSASAPTYALSFAAGVPVERPSTTRIADGVAISYPHDEALAILRRELARVVEVTDDEIEEAMRMFFTDTHNVAEGAGAAALAALLRERQQMAGKQVAVVLSGGNVDADVFHRVLGDRHSAL